MTPAEDHTPITLGVAGAGTMGSGIALAALYADIPVTLYDVDQRVLDQARSYIERFLARKSLSERIEKLELASDLEALAGCSIVIEAAPEKLEVKRDLFSRLDQLVQPPGILATNTSTLSVTAIASTCSNPERVAGMHFFNPAAVMPLVEVIQAAQTDPQVMERLAGLAKRMGKTPVAAVDLPGFIVNRVARPFYGESLRMVGEAAGDPQSIDALVRGAGFPMGPFELMDLIGIDVNLAAARAVYEGFFHEPRFRPHPIQASMMAAGRLGKKSGRGFYRYDSDGQPQGRLNLQVPDAAGEGELRLVGQFWDLKVSSTLEGAGFQVDDQVGSARAAFVLAGRNESLPAILQAIDEEMPPDRPLFCQVVDATWSELAQHVRHPGRLIGFDAAFFAECDVAFLVGQDGVAPGIRDSAQAILSGAGRAPMWFPEHPGTVLSRIVGSLINEAAFAVQSGLADAETIDRAMVLGTNYPHGPIAWGREMGWDRVAAMLDHLHDETGEPRYRAAPALRRWARGIGGP